MTKCLHKTELVKLFDESRLALNAIGDETRQHIILTLLTYGERGVRVNEIAAHSHVSRPTVSHHLQILKAANIINMKRIGTRNYYYMDANESEWYKLSLITKYVYQAVQEISKKQDLKDMEIKG